MNVVRADELQPGWRVILPDDDSDQVVLHVTPSIDWPEIVIVRTNGGVRSLHADEEVEVLRAPVQVGRHLRVLRP